MDTHIPFLGFSEPVSSWSHLVAAIVFLYGGIQTAIKARGNGGRVAAMIIYLVCAFFLFSMSGVYHLLEKGLDANYVLQILDHAGIYLMISGSVTPFQIILLRGAQRWVPLILVWILSITGLTLTAVFFADMPEWLLLIFFVSMGWMSLLSIWFMRHIDWATAQRIVIGGVVYTLGAFFDFARWPVLIPGVLGPHEVFHLFVIAGALIHLRAIHIIADRPITQRLQVLVCCFPDTMLARFRSERGQIEAATEAELRAKVRNWVTQHYYPTLPPREIELKYFKEDALDPTGWLETPGPKSDSVDGLRTHT